MRLVYTRRVPGNGALLGGGRGHTWRKASGIVDATSSDIRWPLRRDVTGRSHHMWLQRATQAALDARDLLFIPFPRRKGLPSRRCLRTARANGNTTAFPPSSWRPSERSRHGQSGPPPLLPLRRSYTYLTRSASFLH